MLGKISTSTLNLFEDYDITDTDLVYYQVDIDLTWSINVQ